jgi:hypothetical protein
MLVFITLGDFIFYACVLLLLADAIGMSNLHLWARLEFALLPGLIVLIRLRRRRPFRWIIQAPKFIGVFLYTLIADLVSKDQQRTEEA